MHQGSLLRLLFCVLVDNKDSRVFTGVWGWASVGWEMALVVVQGSGVSATRGGAAINLGTISHERIGKLSHCAAHPWADTVLVCLFDCARCTFVGCSASAEGPNSCGCTGRAFAAK